MGRRRIGLFEIANHAFFVLLAIIMLYPFWYVIMFSLSGSTKAIVNGYYLVPNGFSLETYRYILHQNMIFSGYKNTAIVTIVGTLLNLVLTVATAYPLAVAPRMPFRRMLSGLMLFTMVFSGGLVPTYLLVRSLGLLDRLWALMIPSAISVYYVLIMMKFFKGIPTSLIEAARVDGYNEIMILAAIVVPVSTSALAAIGLFYAVGHWNEYLSGLIYINSQAKQVLQVNLLSMLTNEGLGRQTGMTEIVSTPQNLKMTAILVTVAPILLLYPFLQRYFIKGVLLGSVKG